MNTSRTRTITLIAGGFVIALAALLCLKAMNLADFSQPGQGIFQGRSNVLMFISFALLTGLASTLLLVISRAGKGAADAPVPGAGQERAADAGPETLEGEPSPAVPGDQAGKGQDAVLSDTAGELRTTVDVIQEELEEILDDEAPVDKTHVQSIVEETDRLKKIIDSMEQLSRVQEIARLNRKELLEIEPLLKGIIETTRQAVPDRDVTYNLECEAGLSLKGDPECIGRIVGNIADNAARSIKSSGTVSLTASRRNGMVVFSVRDTGTGIRRAHLSHIYERFFRGTGTGIGMGLAIVKELVDACGGTIEVQTEVNKGTTFTVQMPG